VKSGRWSFWENEHLSRPPARGHSNSCGQGAITCISSDGAVDDEERERRYDRASEIAAHPSRDERSTRMTYSGEEARS